MVYVFAPIREDLRASTHEVPQSLLQMDSQRASDEEVTDLNFLHVIPKQRIESTGRSKSMEKSWSLEILVIGDDGDPLKVEILQLVLLISTMNAFSLCPQL